MIYLNTLRYSRIAGAMLEKKTIRRIIGSAIVCILINALCLHSVTQGEQLAERLIFGFVAVVLSFLIMPIIFMAVVGHRQAVSKTEASGIEYLAKIPHSRQPRFKTLGFRSLGLLCEVVGHMHHTHKPH